MTNASSGLPQRVLDLAKEAAMFEMLILEQVADVGRLYGGGNALRILSKIETPFECAPHLSDALHIYLATFRGTPKTERARRQTAEFEAAKQRILKDAKMLARIHARYRDAAISAAAATWPTPPTERLQ